MPKKKLHICPAVSKDKAICTGCVHSKPHTRRFECSNKCTSMDTALERGCCVEVINKNPEINILEEF